MDAEIQKFVGDRFVPVWIEDKKDDPLAVKLGLSQEGYPNIAVYDVGNEYLGRVIGFGGKEPWFKSVKETWQVGEKLSGAKAAATKDPALWGAFATLVSDIPGREKDALAAIDRVPEADRAKDFAASRAALASKSAWTDTEKALRANTKDVKTPEAAKAAAPKGLELIEAWIKDFGGTNPKADPVAWARKGSLLVLLEHKAEAAEVAAKILHDWPDSPQTQALLRGLR